MEHRSPNQNFGPLLQPAALGDLEASIAVKVLAAGGDVAIVLDRDGVICDLAVGNSDLQLDDFESWVNKPWSDTVTQDSRPKVEEMLRDAASDKAIRWRELNHPSRRGDSVALRYVAVGTGDDGRIIAIGRDHRAASVLQQRLLQAQQSMERDYARMRTSESRYRMLFQSTSEAVLIIDGSTRRVAEANPAADRLIGGDGSLVGKPFSRLFAVQSQEDAASLLSVAQASTSRTAPQSNLTSNGCQLNVTASLFRQDRSMHFLVRLVPVERSEPIIVDSNHRMLAAINLLPDGLVVTDRDLNILTENSAFLDLVHLPTPEQANGESLARFLGRPGVDRNILLENLVKYGVVRNFPTVLQTQFGELEDVEVCAVSVPEGDDGFYGFSIRRVSRREMERGQQPLELVRSPADMSELVGRVSLKEIVRDTTDFVERLCIEAALDLTGNNRASAAEILGVSRQSLYSKLHRFGIGNFEDDPQ
ncbi:transcriptional regulator PpsR [Aquidulcibacter paucihalophilus]|uniref:transcriptional regulator PpsR n=1 Tax=Aquidulcibacter paucihalophilus TaxID=1978549 RepID=UPI000A19153E|nr:transcriptional regulator PpsR [Aquidulcibacter paucihalophilus]